MGAMLNGLPRRAVRSRRGGSIIAQAIGVLRAKGGSWWQPGPAYTFTGSDGTGAAGDGSDSGYGVDLCATYGPQLVGDAWAGIFGGAPSLSGGTLTVTATGASPYAGASQAIALQAGRTYQASYEVVDASQSDGVYLIVGSDSATAPPRSLTLGPHTTAGTYTAIFTAQADAAGYLSVSAGNGGMAAGETIAFRNISVREIIGRPLFQSTTGFKPKLKRVPKRLGPELVTNGGFSSAAEWVAGSGWAISGGAAQATAGHPWSTVAQAAASLRAGVSYLVSADVSRSSGTLYAQLATVGASVTPFFATASGSFSGVATMPAGTSPSIALLNDGAGSFVGSVDGLSVREVIEWTWAWRFDGVDDCMLSAASPLSGSSDYTLMAAFNSRNRVGYRLAIGVFAPGGQDHMAAVGEYGDAPFLTQYARDISGSGGSTPSVVTGVSSSVGGRELRKNGVVVASAAYHPLTIEPRSIRLGFGAADDYLTGEVFAAAYCPTILSAAEKLVVEKAMAQLAGVTI